MLLVCAGEVSGSLFASALISALKAKIALPVYAVGGEDMAAAGACLLANPLRYSAIGLSENLGAISYFKNLYLRLKAWIRQCRPRALILVDFQGLNLKLAAYAKTLGIPVFYYIAPQEWLWGLPGGARRIVSCVDYFLCVFPQEHAFYQQRGAQSVYLGHPLLDLLPNREPEKAAEQLGLNGKKSICLLPGSRELEFKRLFPILEQASRCFPDYIFTLPLAQEAFRAYLPSGLHNIKLLSASERYMAMLAGEAVWSASGNAVLEAVLLGCPTVALYQVSALTYTVAKALLKLPYITLPNILLNEGWVPELIQDIQAQDILQMHKRVLDPDYYLLFRQKAKALRVLLGETGASQRAAEFIVAKL